MLIHIGYDISIGCFQETPMLLALSVHPSREQDVLSSTVLRITSGTLCSNYIDGFGNRIHRVIGGPGEVRFFYDAVVQDSGQPDEVAFDARETPVAALPDDVLVYLLGSRYCETDRMSDMAWSLFGNVAPGWSRVQAICDYVHTHLAFGYPFARATRTAFESHQERQGVCRDFAHLAITLCRCLNIPARYCTGYLGDIGVPKDPAPMDFSAWFEVWLDGKWYTFDARHNHRRIGRIVMGYGRDATDVAMISTFGQHTLGKFQVWTDEAEDNSFTQQSPQAQMFGQLHANGDANRHANRHGQPISMTT